MSGQEKIITLKVWDQKKETALTVIMQNEESAGAEVAVELQEDVVGGAGDGFLYRTAAELTELRWGLVRAVPTAWKIHGITK